MGKESWAQLRTVMYMPGKAESSSMEVFIEVMCSELCSIKLNLVTRGSDSVEGGIEEGGGRIKRKTRVCTGVIRY